MILAPLNSYANLCRGKIYGEYDNKYLFLVAVFIFEIGSAVCGSAPSLNVLIVGRAICGLGGPAMAPPPGVAPDSLQESNSVFSWFIMTIVLCITLSTLAVVMRLYTKLRIIRQIGWEDCECRLLFMLSPLSWLISELADTSVLGHLMWVAYCVPTTLIMRHGGETHQWDLQLKNLIQILYVLLPLPRLSQRLIAIALIVQQHWSHFLRDYRLHYQTLNTSPILKNFRSFKERSQLLER